jgi:hypothetical protein
MFFFYTKDMKIEVFRYKVFKLAVGSWQLGEGEGMQTCKPANLQTQRPALFMLFVHLRDTSSNNAGNFIDLYRLQ